HRDQAAPERGQGRSPWGDCVQTFGAPAPVLTPNAHEQELSRMLDSRRIRSRFDGGFMTVTASSVSAGEIAAIETVTKQLLDEVRAVRAAWDEGAAALVGKDWDRYSQAWAHTPEVQVIHTAERSWITGWSHLEARYRSVIASPGTLTAETRRFDVSVAPSGDTA